MPTITKIFQYTGTTQELVLPAGTNSMTIHLYGGGGGGGGGDAAGPGRSGAAGHYITKTDLSISAYVGQTMRVAVGGGGGGGTGGGGAPGGANGRSLTGYSGGAGGNSGGGGSSGSGGGGGGATKIDFNGVDIAIAGGGGGGAGDGQHGTGSAGINTNSATAGTPGTLGENGAGHSGDGGGGGAGGGGADGGKGGAGASGDNGGAGGWSGSNLVPSSGSEDNGSGTTPGGTGVSGYVSGVANGAGATGTGGNGLAIIIFTIGVQANYKVSGDWKETTNLYTKVSGAWKEITAAYYKVSGTWKALFNSGVTFTTTAAGFGDSTGLPTSAASGSGGGGGGRVICTWLNNKGMFSLEDLKIDQAFSIKYMSRNVKIGYWFWGIPMVEYMNKSDKTGSWFGGLVIKVIRMLAQARANELAYKMGVRKQGDILGKVTRVIGEGFCWCVGVVVRPFVEHKFGDWLEIYDPEIK